MSDSQVIPADAVEAAIRTMPEYTPDEEADSFDRETNDQCRAKVERILEAAAPYLMARAWDEGFDRGAESYRRDNPYKAARG